MKKTIAVVILCTVLFALCVATEAQETKKTWKIGVLVSGTASINAARDEALRTGLREFGYEEGKNIVLVYK